MRARRLNDVRALLQSSAFGTWWAALREARRVLAAAQAHRDELEAAVGVQALTTELTHVRATQAFYRAGEHDERASRSFALAENLENQGFPGVAEFEEQRFLVSEVWYRLGAAEHALEQARAAPTSKGKAGDLTALERRREQFASQYAVEDAKKNQLWAEVERLWAESCEAGLRGAEERALAGKARHEAERGFARFDEQKHQTERTRAALAEAKRQVDQAQNALEGVTAAGSSFGAAVGTDFLFFRHPGDSRHAYAVGLVEDLEHYNIEVRELAVYSVESARGVGHLEPARVPTFDAENDRRFEEYFLTGRRGQPRASVR